MQRRKLHKMFCAGALALVAMASQAQKKIAKVGFLATGDLSATPRILSSFKERMHALGWVEGQNVQYLVLSADGYVDRLDALARRMVEEKVDVIVAGPPSSAVAARKATKLTPIVMGNVPDPITLGLAASLARPGGNVTGVSSQTSVLVAKQMELLKLLLPGAKRIGMLVNDSNPSAVAFRETAATAASALQMTLFVAAANQPQDMAAAIQRLARDGVQAVVVPADPMFLGARIVLNELLAKANQPAAFGNRDHALDGALVSYAPDIIENFRIAAGYVDRILKGADPAQLAIGQSDKIELTVNQKTAKALGIVIPQSVLLRADEVIR